MRYLAIALPNGVKIASSYVNEATNLPAGSRAFDINTDATGNVTQKKELVIVNGCVKLKRGKKS